MKKVIDILASKHKELPRVTIETIVNSQFQFVRSIMKQGDFKSIRLRYLGIFGVKKGRLAYFKNKRNESTEQDTTV